MKIKFTNGREYEVLSVKYHVDKNNVPIDIVIIGEQEVLYNIADEQCLLGFNIQQLQLGIEDVSLYEALYGRLDTFTLSNFMVATIEDDIITYIKNKTNENK